MSKLIDIATKIFNEAIDAFGSPKEKELLEKAAEAYEKAGKPEDAEVCRLLIEE